MCDWIYRFALERNRARVGNARGQSAIAKIYRPELALIGDSLAERSSWRKLRSPPFSVVNLAKGGDVLRQIVPQADDARRMGARTVLVSGGTNDLIVDRAPVAHIAFDFAILMRALDQVPRKIVTLVPTRRTLRSIGTMTQPTPNSGASPPR
jgi:hypothetical protein